MSGGRTVHLPRRVSPDSARLTCTIRLCVSLLLLVGLLGCSGRGDDQSAGGAGEIWLTAADDPGPNPFMPPMASPLADKPLPGPDLKPQGDGTEVVARQQSGDEPGLYGGSQQNAAVDREKMIGFLRGHPAKARAFVAALNTDGSLRWSQGTSVAVDQVGAYIRELTPAFLRVDTRVTLFGYHGTNPVALQSILQAGTAVLLDSSGVPRVRGFAGNPLTAPVALDVPPQQRGTPWPGYHPGVIVVVQPAKTVIRVFVLVDMYTGATFERAAGTTGAQGAGSAPPDGPAAGATTRYDGTYVSVNSPSKATVVVRDGRIVSFSEEAAGAGRCELAIEADFVIRPPTGEFSGKYTGSVGSGPFWCVATNGTMSGRVEGTQMTMTYTNATSGASFDLLLVRS